ncbi:MAG: LicD family protein [Muribaculaceae bacterium]|nr:LicD family protein [Muribaculaceae bacterium]
MKQLTTEELRDIQLQILIEVDKFCRENKLKYSLAYGTLLGAARHGGYIPWDDDIDIMMPREDYDKFIATFSHPYMEVYSSRHQKSYLLPYAKVGDSRTLFDELSSQRFKAGINIDIFPVDNFAHPSPELQKWFEKKSILDKIFDIKIIPFRNSPIDFKLQKSYYYLKYPFLTLRRLRDKIEKTAQFFNSVPSGIVGVLSTPRTSLDCGFPSSILQEFSEIEFEGIPFICVKKVDEYLTYMYGDWRQLPPADKQVTHHLYKAYKKLS